MLYENGKKVMSFGDDGKTALDRLNDGIQVPAFGEDGVTPDGRAWVALAMTTTIWSILFTVVFFVTRPMSLHDAVIDHVYIVELFITFIAVLVVAMPALTTFVAPVLDGSAAHDTTFVSALKFGGVGLVASLIPALMITAIDPSYGWIPWVQFLIPSALAGFITRLMLDGFMRHSSARVLSFVVAAIVVTGALLVGIGVLNGDIAAPAVG